MARENHNSPELEKAFQKAAEEGEAAAEIFKKERAASEEEPLIKSNDETMADLEKIAEAKLSQFDVAEQESAETTAEPDQKAETIKNLSIALNNMIDQAARLARENARAEKAWNSLNRRLGKEYVDFEKAHPDDQSDEYKDGLVGLYQKLTSELAEFLKQYQ